MKSIEIGRFCGGAIAMVTSVGILGRLAWVRFRKGPDRFHHSQLSLVLTTKLVAAFIAACGLLLFLPCNIEASCVWVSQTIDNLMSINLLLILFFTVRTSRQLSQITLPKAGECEVDLALAMPLSRFGGIDWEAAKLLASLPTVKQVLKARPMIIGVQAGTSVALTVILLAVGLFGEWVPWCLFNSTRQRVLYTHSQTWSMLFLNLFGSAALVLLQHSKQSLHMEPEKAQLERAIRRLARALMTMMLMQIIWRVPSSFKCTTSYLNLNLGTTEAVSTFLDTMTAFMLPSTMALAPAVLLIKLYPTLVNIHAVVAPST